MDQDPLPGADPLLCILSAINFAVGPLGIDQITALLFALAALLVSGFVSGSEISFFSLTPSQCDQLKGSERGQKVLAMLQTPERLLATILIANNLVNVTIVILINYGLGPVFTGMPEVWSFIIQTVLLTFLILLFGEILPKLYANSNNMKWALFAEPGVNLFMKALWPLSSLLVSSSTIVNKVVTRKVQTVTTDELSQALEITDVRAADDKEMLEGILRFGDTTASEVMTPRVDITDIDISASFDQVLKVVVESGYSRLPVCDKSQDNIKGILYSRDLLPYIGRDTAGFDWRTLLREPYYVPESRMIDDLLEDFRRRHIHMAVVVDEFGGTRGIVTLEDVLEEIVGDINDEYDEEEKTYSRLPDNTFIFEGKTLLGDFFRITGLNEADYEPVAADCETLAGMLLAIKGDFPKEKESIGYGYCRFMVLDIEQHRIKSVRVKVMDQPQTPRS